MRFSILLPLLAFLAYPTFAQDDDPLNPDAIELPLIGSLEGELHCVTAVLERFGRTIYAVGDVDGDSLSDWILARRRCDTSVDGYAVVELLLYHGVRGGIPETRDGVRIGPEEIASDCSFIGAGDYDGDGYRDLVIGVSVKDDPVNAGLPASALVVFWNDQRGGFSCADTSHLTRPNQRIGIMGLADQERVAAVPIKCDVDRDGSEDLVVVTLRQWFVDGAGVPAPNIMIYRGHRGARWGRNGVSIDPDWQLWKRLFTHRVAVLDHDGDGALDIVMYVDDEIIGRRGGVSIVYGRRGMLPDTTFEHVDFVRTLNRDSKHASFIDVTGDRVPELIITTADSASGTSYQFLVYVGGRGQRLLEQYGTGNDPPQPGAPQWWGKPWAIIRTANAISNNWTTPSLNLFDVGDIGLDGTGDFCTTSYPIVVCYSGGQFFDEYIDAMIPMWPPETERLLMVKNLGDIDGSGRAAIAVPSGGGGVWFYRTSPDVPASGDAIRRPSGTDVPASTQQDAYRSSSELNVAVAPNPTTSFAVVSWRDSPHATHVLLQDLFGHDLRRWAVPLGRNEQLVDIEGMPAGIYTIVVRSRTGSSSARIVVQR